MSLKNNPYKETPVTTVPEGVGGSDWKTGMMGLNGWRGSAGDKGNYYDYETASKAAGRIAGQNIADLDRLKRELEAERERNKREEIRAEMEAKAKAEEEAKAHQHEITTQGKMIYEKVLKGMNPVELAALCAMGGEKSEALFYGITMAFMYAAKDVPFPDNIHLASRMARLLQGTPDSSQLMRLFGEIVTMWNATHTEPKHTTILLDYIEERGGKR